MLRDLLSVSPSRLFTTARIAASAPIVAVLATALVAALCFGCSSEPATPVAPVGTLTVQLQDQALPYPQWITLRLRWSATTSLEPRADGPVDPSANEPRFFVHLLDPDGELVRTYDRDLGGTWKPGEGGQLEVSLHHSALAPPLAPGPYTVAVGLYASDGRRFPLEVSTDSGPAEPLGRLAYTVAELQVPPVGLDAPTFAFHGGWGVPAALEGTARRGQPSPQPLDPFSPGARLLNADADVEVLNLEVPGSLLLRLEIPASTGTSADGAPRRLDITGDCSQAQRTVSGPGVHRLVMPVHPTGDEPRCRLNFYPSTPTTETFAHLQVMAWAPAQL